MDDELARRVRRVLESQTAALGTLHAGEPYVSMVPFALLTSNAEFAIHVSALAAHTKDMLENPAVSLLVVALPNPEVLPQALARLTIQGEARRLAADDSAHGEAQRAYLARFPDSAMMFELTDFSLFAIRPRTIRFVGGFAQAKSLSAETLAKILAG